MADLGTVGIAIEVRGREALRQLESDMGVVDRSAKSAARSFEAFERAGLKTAETFRYVSDAAKKRLADEQRITQELVKQRNAAEQLARANAQKFQSQIGSNLGLGARGISAGASASAFEGEIERLRVKYDQIYASSQLYERSLNELNQAHRFGVLSTKQHEVAVESLNLEYQNFQNGIVQAGNRFSKYTAQSAGRMNQFGVVTQQAGYQIGDFLVQVQSGTNWMVAFGQQATQLVGVLPLMGAGFMGLSTGALVTLSAGLGIAVPLITALGAAWMRTSDGVKSGADKQKQAYESVTQALENLRLERQMEASGVGSTSEQTLLNEVVAIQAERKVLAQEILALEGQIGAEYSLQIAGERGRLAARDNELRLVEQRNRLILDEIKAERDRAEQVERAKRAVVAAYEAYASTRMESEQVAEQVQLIESGMSQAAVDALRFAGVDLASGVSAAAREAAILAANMGISLNAAMSLINLTSSQTYGQVGARSDPRDFLPGGKKFSSSGFKPFVFESPSKGSKGGGGGGQDKIDPLEDLRQQIKLETELLGLSEAQARVIQALGKDRSKYSQAEINAITAEIEAYNQKQEAIERTKNIMDTVKSSMEDAFMSMVDGTKSAKEAFKTMAFEIVKELYRVLVVQRLVGAISGAFSGGAGLMTAPATGSLGLPFGLATGGSVMPGKSYLVGENGPELVIPRHSGTVVNANQTASMGGGSSSVTVQNNITVTGSDAAMVRTEIAKMIPQITNATKAAVIDAKQRGGQMAQAFR